MSPRVFVPGVPVGQGSKRHVGRGIMVESSKLLEPWRQTVARKLEDMLGDGHEPTPHALSVNLRFIFTRPRGHYGAQPCPDCRQPSKRELLELAAAAGVEGRSKMSAAELAEALELELPDRDSCAGCHGSGRVAYVLASAARAPASRPDLDKLVRAILDAMTGLAFQDDGQVVALNAGKEYGNAGGCDIRWDVIR